MDPLKRQRVHFTSQTIVEGPGTGEVERHKRNLRPSTVVAFEFWVVALPFSPILTIHSTQQWSTTSTTRSLSILGAYFSLGRFECRRSSQTAANVSLRCHSPTARISRPSCGCDFIQYMQINCVERLFVLSCCRTTTLKWSRAVDGAGSKGGSNKISLTRFLAKRDDYFAYISFSGSLRSRITPFHARSFSCKAERLNVMMLCCCCEAFLRLGSVFSGLFCAHTFLSANNQSHQPLFDCRKKVALKKCVRHRQNFKIIKAEKLKKKMFTSSISGKKCECAESRRSVRWWCGEQRNKIVWDLSSVFGPTKKQDMWK